MHSLIFSERGTVSEIMYILERDRDTTGQEKGATFLRWPCFNLHFWILFLKCCEELYIHKAIETEALADTAVYLRIMCYMDFCF